MCKLIYILGKKKKTILSHMMRGNPWQPIRNLLPLVCFAIHFIGLCIMLLNVIVHN